MICHAAPLLSKAKMVYTCYDFSDLVTNYSSWESLRTFLESEEGGKLRIIQKEGDPFAIVRYVKGQSDLGWQSKPWVRWMRSVVWDTHSNRPVCVAPPKAYSDDVPNHVDRPEIAVEEFVEGVMVNAFLAENGSLQLSTRSSLGASTGYYSQKTFAEMMADALAARGVSLDQLATLIKSKGTFASFVLQHPEHRVVQKNESPNVALIYCGTVNPNGSVEIYETPAEWTEGFQSWGVKTYPPLAPGETAAQRLEMMIRTAESTWQGLVFRGPCGTRWRLRSLSYKILRDLRGKESRIEERFSRLRAQNMVRLYTQNWPEETAAFLDLEKRLRGLTSKIYTEYCAVHKEKSKLFLDVPVPLRSPVYHLHGIYLNNLRAQNLTVKMPLVIQFVNTMKPEEQAALLRSSVEVDLTQGNA